MVFSSSYFLFLFLPLALAICLPLRGWLYLAAITLVSLAFYFWSAGTHTIILAGIIVVNWLGALALTRWPDKPLFPLLIIGNLLVLVVFKYAGFLSANIDAVAGTGLHQMFGGIVLPAGVSFFVFQAISYITDVRRKDIEPDRSLVAYSAYQSFFPHLIAGPIVRYRDVIGDIRQPVRSVDNFAIGVTRFAHGLFKKVVIADGVAPIADAVFALPASDVDFATAWIGAVAYGIQIYFDFSGYSDMAIGMARMFGIRFHENFERPYASRSITEFWRRWHISLSSWFRDYVYIPLGGSRGSAFVTYRNLLIVFAVTGLWHGAAWTFVLWGLYHGLFLMAERMAFRTPLTALTHPAARWLYCLPVVIFGWVLFRAGSLDQALQMWSAMAVPSVWADFPDFIAKAALTPLSIAALVAGIAIYVLPGRTSWGWWLMQDTTVAWARQASTAYTVAALCWVAMVVLTGSYSPFLYFAF
jgi:alginate O-acetyltransferase complex protein AlgI